MLLGYLLETEAEEKGREIEDQFRMMVFANSPELYGKIFPQSPEETTIDEQEIEWRVPESQGELAQLAAEMGLEVPDD